MMKKMRYKIFEERLNNIEHRLGGAHKRVCCDNNNIYHGGFISFL